MPSAFQPIGAVAAKVVKKAGTASGQTYCEDCAAPKLSGRARYCHSCCDRRARESKRVGAKPRARSSPQHKWTAAFLAEAVRLGLSRRDARALLFRIEPRVWQTTDAVPAAAAAVAGDL